MNLDIAINNEEIAQIFDVSIDFLGAVLKENGSYLILD